MLARLERMDTPRGRLIATSDIHGSLKLFNELLELIRLTDEDALVIVGDMCERGKDSLGVIRRAMELSRRGNVRVLAGNKDLRAIEYATGENGRVGSVVTKYVDGMADWGCSTLFRDMCREAGVPYSSDMDVTAAQSVFKERFRAEIEFVKSLATFLETPEYMFVHGGVPSGEFEKYVGRSADEFLKWDDFICAGVHFDKYIIVGHTPASLYRPDYASSAPYICPEQKIIDIDGGVGIKFDAQLNAIILPHGGGDFKWISAHGRDVRYALDAQTASSDPVNLRWRHNEVEILSIEGDAARIRHVETGTELYAPVTLLYDRIPEYVRGGKCLCDDISSYELDVQPGDELRIYFSTSHGYVAKKGDISGWYMGRISDRRPYGG